MKRTHADTRHRGQLLDCVSHRLFWAETTLVPTATLQSRGSRDVRVKRKRKKIWEERWIMPDNIERPDSDHAIRKLRRCVPSPLGRHQPHGGSLVEGEGVPGSQ